MHKKVNSIINSKHKNHSNNVFARLSNQKIRNIKNFEQIINETLSMKSKETSNSKNKVATTYPTNRVAN